MSHGDGHGHAETAMAAGHTCSHHMGHAMGHSSTFHFSTSATLLFSGVSVGPDLFTYALACAAVVALGVARQELLRACETEAFSAEKRSGLFFAQAVVSYLLMLVAMTFNVGLFLSVILGLTLGYHRSITQARAIKAQQSECCA